MEHAELPPTARSRTRRRQIPAAVQWALAVLVGVSLWATQGSGWANVEPGPTPNLTTVLLDQNDPDQLDPTFGDHGRWHATTINATALSWWDWARCHLDRHCDLFPLATGSNARHWEQQAMDRSVTEAIDLARTWAGGDTDHPVPTHADLGPVGGASAGLMLTLALIDAATPGDLTGGKVIAGTGTVNSLAEVGSVTGVPFKVAGALDTGAEVFFTPHRRYDEAVTAAEGTDLEVVPVQYVSGALTWLCAHGGTSPVCTSAALTN